MSTLCEQGYYEVKQTISEYIAIWTEYFIQYEAAELRFQEVMMKFKAHPRIYRAEEAFVEALNVIAREVESANNLEMIRVLMFSGNYRGLGLCNIRLCIPDTSMIEWVQGVQTTFYSSNIFINKQWILRFKTHLTKGTLAVNLI